MSSNIFYRQGYGDSVCKALLKVHYGVDGINGGSCHHDNGPRAWKTRYLKKQKPLQCKGF